MGSGFDRVPALIGILVCKGFEFDRNSGLFGIRFDKILVLWDPGFIGNSGLIRIRVSKEFPIM